MATTLAVENPPLSSLTPFNNGVLTHIDLYVDEKNENKYYIDTDSIDV